VGSAETVERAVKSSDSARIGEIIVMKFDEFKLWESEVKKRKREKRWIAVEPIRRVLAKFWFWSALENANVLFRKS